MLYVAAGTMTRVRFVGLLAPRALPGPELQGLVEVGSLGEGSLVISPERDLAEGELLARYGYFDGSKPLKVSHEWVT